MNDKKHAIFLSEQYCDGDPSKGETNSQHNLFQPFRKHCTNWNLTNLYIEEGNIDNRLREFCSNNPVDVIFVSLLGGSPLNPSIDVLHDLKREGKKIIYCWFDTGPNFGTQDILQISDKATLHILIDAPHGPHLNNLVGMENVKVMWTPESDDLYFPIPEEQKDIDISFLGTKCYWDRSQYLNQLYIKYPNMYIGGGQREQKLSPEDYALIVRRSKIGINFPLSSTRVFTQLKGRILEYMMSGSLVLEGQNESTRRFFTPGEDYVEFTSQKDLFDKIDYYLHNKEERIRIASNGLKRFNENYTAKHFFDSVFRMIGEE